MSLESADAATSGSEAKSNCLFCRIARGEEEKTQLHYQDGRFAVFSDIKPAARLHYLVVPRAHHGNVKFMTGTEADIELVQDMLSIGHRMLQEKSMDVSDARFGFHWAPFHTIEHLHLHVIAPVSEMGFMARMIFRPNSYWFVTSDWLQERLRTLAAESKPEAAS